MPQTICDFFLLALPVLFTFFSLHASLRESLKRELPRISENTKT